MNLMNYHLSYFLLLPLVVWFVYYRQKKQRLKYLNELGEGRTLQRLINYSYKRGSLKKWLMIAGILFIVVAMLRPQWGLKKEKVTKKGLDIVLALDVSASMKARDIMPDRLSKSVMEIQKLLKRLEGDRVGLVTFSGSATAVCPLTLDYGAVEMFLKSMKYYKEPLPGTNIPAAFNAALEMYDFEATQDRLFLIFTDGESHEGNMGSIKNKAKTKGIIVVPIAVGTKGGQPIPDYDAKGNRKGYKKDKKGEVVISHVDSAGLKKIATLGPYAIDSSDASIVSIIGDFRSYKRANLQELKISVYSERYQIFLFIGLLFVLLSFFISDFKDRVYRDDK